MNTNGGTILIGVTDNGSINGIEYDLKNPDRDDKDEFSQILSQVIENYIGAHYNKYIHHDFVEKER